MFSHNDDESDNECSCYSNSALSDTDLADLADSQSNSAYFYTLSSNISNVLLRKLELLFLLVFNFFCKSEKPSISVSSDPGFHHSHCSDVDNDEHCLEGDGFKEMVTEVEQVDPCNTCPFIYWEAIESIDDDFD